MKIFLDSSALVKLYHFETGTTDLDILFETYPVEEVFLSDLAKVEFNSAFQNKVRTKDLTALEVEKVIASFIGDYDKFTFLELKSELILKARTLIDSNGFRGLRTLDTIQLASILSVKSELALAVTADDLLRTFIEEEGVQTK